MGAVVGENLKRNQSFYQNKIPFIMISKSGGARMMEAAYSLMQLAKTSVNLPSLLRKKYISLCTDPTGGTTASYAMLGDINISEPGALIGFAGPRVVRHNKDLEGFQTAEFLLEHGFLDFITPRKELKDKINLYIDLIQNNDIR
jgi:acetyl-CoA carboxylase carboxyl transferase subunit beta